MKASIFSLDLLTRLLSQLPGFALQNTPTTLHQNSPFILHQNTPPDTIHPSPRSRGAKTAEHQTQALHCILPCPINQVAPTLVQVHHFINLIPNCPFPRTKMYQFATPPAAGSGALNARLQKKSRHQNRLPGSQNSNLILTRFTKKYQNLFTIAVHLQYLEVQN